MLIRTIQRCSYYHSPTHGTHDQPPSSHHKDEVATKIAAIFMAEMPKISPYKISDLLSGGGTTAHKPTNAARSSEDMIIGSSQGAGSSWAWAVLRAVHKGMSAG
jgi:hypothetical protein